MISKLKKISLFPRPSNLRTNLQQEFIERNNGPGEVSGGRATSLPGEEGSWLVCNISRVGGKDLPDKKTVVGNWHMMQALWATFEEIYLENKLGQVCT